MMNGILIINKPAGPTSHDVVDKIRKLTETQKVGHAGTLDPFARGVLIILIGKATKLSENFLKQDKTYIATLLLGKESDTYDKTGKIKNINDRRPKIKEIKKILKSFVGEIEQKPPMFSAIKVKGQKLYELAHQGKKIELAPRLVKIHSIKILKYNYPEVKIEVKCASGTYIRSLAHDTGKKLKTGALLKELIRTQSGKFRIKDAVKLENLTKENIKKYIKESC